jgi:flagellin-like hook-associated protein FlgL
MQISSYISANRPSIGSSAAVGRTSISSLGALASSGASVGGAADSAADPVVTSLNPASAAEAGLALRAAQDAVNMPLRTSNALAVADHTLGKIQGFIEEVGRNVSDRQNESSADQTQSNIDQAVANIDQLANGAAFDGQKLLDGSFAAQSGTASLTLAAFTPGALGASNGSLRSLVSGGAYSVGGGEPGEIVAGASAQVSLARSQIVKFQSLALRPLIAAALGTLNASAATAPINDAAAAQTAALLTRAQMALNPMALSEAASGNVQGVMYLLA